MAKIDRRQWITSTSVGLFGLAGGLSLADRVRADVSRLDQYDPRGDLAAYPRIREILFDPDKCKSLIAQLWQGYNQTRDIRYGEWALIYGFPWWRTAKDRTTRIKFSQISQKMAQQMAANHPESVIGHQWLAIHMGTEVLSVGVVDALHAIPQLRKSLERAMAIDAHYFYSLPTLILAKLYSKLPQFPISIGDLDHALALLAEVRPQQEDVFAVWHLFKAETLYLKGRKEDALKILSEIDAKVTPQDNATAYLQESTLYDVRVVAPKFKAGNYERYMWDPLLEVPQPG